jgi:hypothetical protein
MGKNIDATKGDSLEWDASDPRGSLQALRAHAELQTQKAIDWYYSKKAHKARGSWLYRFGAIIATALGGIIPIALPLLVTDANQQLRWNQVGYVCVGLAAVCLALDRFTGSSSGWMRYIGSGMRLETLLEEFRLDWVRMNAELGGRSLDATTMAPFLERVKALCLGVRGEVEKETQAWIAEFQSNLAQLEKETREALEDVKAEARKDVEAAAKQREDMARSREPGAIQVTLKSAAALDRGFALELDGAPRGQGITGVEFGIDRVEPGLHSIAAIAESGGKSLRTSKIVKVTAHEVTGVTLEL